MFKGLMIAALSALQMACATPQPYDVNAAFRFACERTEYNCAGIPPPTVSVGWLEEYHAYGVYFGRGQIVLDQRAVQILTPIYVQAILTHETVHYLDDLMGKAATGCETERHAFGVSNTFFVVNGRRDLVAFDWRDSYEGC